MAIETFEVGKTYKLTRDSEKLSQFLSQWKCNRDLFEHVGTQPFTVVSRCGDEHVFVKSCRIGSVKYQFDLYKGDLEYFDEYVLDKSENNNTLDPRSTLKMKRETTLTIEGKITLTQDTYKVFVDNILSNFEGS